MDLLVILILILLNGVCAMAELAVVSSKRVRLDTLAGQGSQGARTAIELADQPSAFLSTVQVGITVISIFNGAFGEASLVARLSPKLEAIPALAQYARPLALALVVAGITFFSIVLGELVPKRLAMRHPEAIAALVARPMRALSVLMTPFVKILSLTTDLVTRLLGMHKDERSGPTPEEISGILKEGSEAGVLERTESDIAQRAVRLDDVRLPSIMTPRIDVVFIDLLDAPADNLARIAASPYSRFPVCRGDSSQVLGIVNAADLFEQAVRQGGLQAVDIAAALTQPVYVPASNSAMGLLDLLRERHAEVALVIDEHGQVQGMVTLIDLMEALVGGLDAGQDEDAVQREDGSWLIDGALSLQRCRELLEPQSSEPLRFPDEERGEFQTVAGFVLHQLGHLPEATDYVDACGFHFEVVDMDRRRIDRVLVSKLEPGGPDAVQ